MKQFRNRRKHGLSLVELAAAMAFGFPIVAVTIYAVIEANMLFAIRTNCDAACRRAAQLLIDDYRNNGKVASPSYTTAGSNKNLPAAIAFDIPTSDGHYFVNRNAKMFTWTWDVGNVNAPDTVTVTVKYPTAGDGANGLFCFPYPDPLNIKNKFAIAVTGTFAVPPN